MNKIALFGATGKTGSIVLNKLLARNYQVRVLVRNRAKLSNASLNLEVIEANILDEETVLKTIKGTDAIINVIGHVKGCPPNLQTIATHHILRAMQETGISRLINLTGNGVLVEGDKPGMLDKLLFYIMTKMAGQAMKNRFSDGIAHARIIRESPVKWTIVRAPVLIAKPATGKIRVGFVGEIPGFSLRYEDLAAEIINILESNTYIHQCPYFTNG